MTDNLMLDELPDILVKEPGKKLTELQIAHLAFLYTRTRIPRDHICALMGIDDLGTLERLIRRRHIPLRQPKRIQRVRS